jgi:membrane-associated protease RseP (regulator of RpoE activity)
MSLVKFIPVGRCCPLCWSLAGAGGLLALAVVIPCLTIRADAAPVGPIVMGPGVIPVPEDAGKKPAAKLDLAKRGQPVPQGLGAFKPNDGGKLDNPREAAANLQEHMRRQMQALQQQQMQAMRQQPQFNRFFAGGFGQQARLGVQVQKPSDALADQLNLPEGKGLVIENVEADSPAAKAGIKPHDILLEFKGKPVSNDAQELVQLMEDVKAKTPVDAVVLRKGKKETIKGILLAEPQAEAFAAPGFVRKLPVPENFAPFPAPGGFRQPNFAPQPGAFPAPFFDPQGGLQRNAREQSVVTTNFRTDDRFTTRHQEGSLIITVTGTVADGKVKVSRIQIQDGTESKKYEGVAEVPEQYRDKVKNLVELNEKSNTRLEIKPLDGKKEKPKDK